MTYGQTVGLTHDAELVGNWQALGWGLLGLFIKGGHLDRFGGRPPGHRPEWQTVPHGRHESAADGDVLPCGSWEFIS